MTEFNKACGALEALKERYDELVDYIDSPEELSSPALGLFLAVTDEFNQVTSLAIKFRKRLMIKDEEKQVYGPKMRTKVEEWLDKFDTLQTVWEEQVMPRFEYAAQRFKIEQDRRNRLAEAERKEREEEEFRKRDEAAKTFEEERSRQAQEKEDLAKLETEVEAQERERIMAEREGRERAIKEMPPSERCETGLKQLLTSSSLTVAEVRSAFQNLCELVSAIVESPDDENVRTIRLANDMFREKLSRFPGIVLFLRGIGFEPKLTMRDMSERDQTMEGWTDVDFRYIHMDEPKLPEAYEAWNAWLLALKKIQSALKEIQTLLPTSFESQGEALSGVARHKELVEEVMKKWRGRGE